MNPTTIVMLHAMCAWPAVLYIWSPRAVKKELFPIWHYFWCPGCIISILLSAIFLDEGWERGVDVLIAALYALLWYTHRNDGDDRWNKRRKKLMEKVKVSQGKLVVVPIKN